MKKCIFFILALTAVMLTGCSNEEKNTDTSAEDAALAAAAEGFWEDDFRSTEDNRIFLEFTGDSYIFRECDMDEWKVYTYPEVEYTFEQEMIKTDSGYAKIKFSVDGNTLYWITDDKTLTYSKVSRDEVLALVAGGSAEADIGISEISEEAEGGTDTSPVFLAEAGASGVKIYGRFGKVPTIFVEDNGITDEFRQDFNGEKFTLSYCGWQDIDEDGSSEVICIVSADKNVQELLIYKKSEGHYAEYRFDAADTLGRRVDYAIDNDNSWLDFAAYGTNDIYSTSTAKAYPEGIYKISFGDVIGYEYEDGKIMLAAEPRANNGNYECMPEITAEVLFDGENFSLENIYLN